MNTWVRTVALTVAALPAFVFGLQGLSNMRQDYLERRFLRAASSYYDTKPAAYGSIKTPHGFSSVTTPGRLETKDGTYVGDLCSDRTNVFAKDFSFFRRPVLYVYPNDLNAQKAKEIAQRQGITIHETGGIQ